MTLVQMSFSAAIMIVIITLVRSVALNQLPKTLLTALWGLVLIRLLVPYSFSFGYQIPAFLPSIQEEFNAGSMQVANTIEYDNVKEGGNVSPVETISLLTVLKIIWVSGALLFSLFFIFSYIKIQKKFRLSLPVEWEFVIAWQQEQTLKNGLQVRVLDQLDTPLTYGILKPTILLPKSMNKTDMKQIKYVLTHELTHIKNKDAIKKLILLIAVCIHWFNPFVWIMLILANRDIELLCDEQTIRSCGISERSAYALALLNMEHEKNHMQPLYSNFNKYAIKERIDSIMNMNKKKYISLTVILFALLAMIGLTFPINAEISKDTSITYDDIDSEKVEKNYETSDTAHEAYEPGNSSNIAYSGEVVYTKKPGNSSDIDDSGNSVYAPEPGIGSDIDSEDSVYVKTSDVELATDSYEVESLILIESELESEWAQFGLTYASDGKHLLYKGELVSFFADNRLPASDNSDCSFSGTIYDNSNNGKYYLETRRDENGDLIAIDEISQKKADKMAFWR